MSSVQSEEVDRELEADEKPQKKKRRFKLPPRDPDVNKWGWGFAIKVVLMALVNAFGVYVLIAAYFDRHWGIFFAMLALVVIADWVYFSGRTLPLKYILPGLAFLLVFQIYTIFYTFYVSFTNYGDGHNVTKEMAVQQLLLKNDKRVPDSPTYPLVVLEQGDVIGFAVLDDGEVKVGTAEDPLEPAVGAKVTDGKITEVPGWDIMTSAQMNKVQTEVTNLRVPISEDAALGAIRTTEGRTGYVTKSVMEYDAEANTMTNTETGVVYKASKTGTFVSEDGQKLSPGWRVGVGATNYTKAFSGGDGQGDTKYFYQVLWWTFAQAILSVFLTFVLGLFLAITFNKKIKGQKIYRTLMILPYAIPGFISALIFKGMFNKSYGFVNEVILGGTTIPWLTDPWLAKFTILFVNLWLGFPYMFLIATGSLQAIPEDLTEAAKIDGAGPWRLWWSIKFPMVLIATAPLLISSFAFNFNNFALTYMLTGGGPSFATKSSIGHTDILITMVYKMSGIDGGAAKDYGLASALSILIFVVVGTISAIAFRQTRKLEEMM